jgi:hypothetical protein
MIRTREGYAMSLVLPDVPPVYEDENAEAVEFEKTIVNLLRTSQAQPDRAGDGRGRRRWTRFQLTIWGQVLRTLGAEHCVSHQVGRLGHVETALPEVVPRVEIQSEVPRAPRCR